MTLVVDAHAHADVKFGWAHSPEDVLERMKEAAIDKSVLSTYWEIPGPDAKALDRLVEALRKYPGNFIGFARMNPWYGEEAVELYSEAVEKHGIRGMKLHPITSVSLPHGELTSRLLRRAGELNTPVLFHSGDDPLSLPLQIGRAAKLHPNTAIMMGHMGGFFYVEDAIKVAVKYENIILETSLMPYPQLVRKAVEKVGASRIVFGSDSPGVHPLVERMKVEAAGLSRADLRMVLGESAARILNLEVPG